MVNFENYNKYCYFSSEVHNTYFPEIVACYYQSWAEELAPEERFYIENIDVDLCTHIIYSFVGLGADASIRLLDPKLDLKSNGLKRFTDLRKKNPNVKTMVSMGGWNEGSDNYTKYAQF